VSVAIFVLPFNSALNPFLYTISILLEKWRKALDDRLVSKETALFLIENWLGRRIVTPADMESKLGAAMSAAATVSTTTPVTKEMALNHIDAWLDLKVITLKDLPGT
jgi:hypothetical protein